MRTIAISHYVFEQFTPGYVLMKSGAKNPALLNYNGLSEEMVFEENGQKMALSEPQLSAVDSVVIKGRKFVRKEGTFMEVLLSKPDSMLFVEYKCNVAYPGRPSGPGRTSQTSSNDQFSTLGAQGVFYELKLPDGFKTKPYLYYWLEKDGVLNKIKTLNQLTKLYPDQKDASKKFIKANKVNFKDQESIVALVEHLQGL